MSEPQIEADEMDGADNKAFMLTLKKYYEMKIIIMMVLFVLSVASSKSATSVVQTSRIINPSIEVKHQIELAYIHFCNSSCKSFNPINHGSDN